MGRTVIIRGGALSDDMFSLDESIFGVSISWNTTRIQRDANAGRFGPPERVPMSLMPPMGDEQRANIDWEKVSRLALEHRRCLGRGELKKSPLLIPVLQVLFAAPDGKTYRSPIDGNHRICARQVLGMDHFDCFVVPQRLEAAYRVTEEIIDDT